MAFRTSYFLLLVLFQQQVAPVAVVKHHDLTSEDIPRPFLKGERRLGRVVLYRSIGTNTHFERDPSFSRDRHLYPSRPHFQDQRGPADQYHSLQRYRPRLNNLPVGGKKFSEERIDYLYPKHPDTDSHARRQIYRPDRRHQSSSNYVNRFNYGQWNENHGFHNNPHLNFYDDFRTRFRSDLPQGFYPLDELEPIEGNGPGGYKHIIHSFPPLADIHSLEPPPLVHKDMTRVHFPSNDISNNLLGVFKERHRFSPAIHQIYKGVPVYNNTSDGNSSEKDYDPHFLALYKSVLETYRKKQYERKKEQQKIEQAPKNNEILSQISRKPNKKTQFIAPQQQIPPNDKITFLNFVQEIDKLQHRQQAPDNYIGTFSPNILEPNVRSHLINHISKFRPSPPYYKYSEPDPLYHPNRSPFQTHELPPSEISTTELPKTTLVTAAHKTTIIPSKFPDSINAQLPPPAADVDTRIPYVAATVVTPQTTTNDQTTATQFLQRSSMLPTGTYPSTAKNTVALQSQWDVGATLSVQKHNLHHEVPLFNVSEVTFLQPTSQDSNTTMISKILEKEHITSTEETPLSKHEHIILTEETQLSKDPKSETSMSDTMLTTSHFLPTIVSEPNLYTKLSHTSQTSESNKTQTITSQEVSAIASQDSFNRDSNTMSFVSSTEKPTNLHTTSDTGHVWAHPENKIITHFETHDPKKEESYRIINALQMSFGERIATNRKSLKPKITPALPFLSASVPHVNLSHITFSDNIHTYMPNMSSNNQDHVQEIQSIQTMATPTDPDTHLASNAHTTESITILENNYDTTATAHTTFTDNHMGIDTKSPTLMINNTENIFEGVIKLDSYSNNNNLQENESTISVAYTTETTTQSLNEETTSNGNNTLNMTLLFDLNKSSEEQTTTQNVFPLSSTPLSHIMSLINHARTHIILSQNDTNPEESSWDDLY